MTQLYAVYAKPTLNIGIYKWKEKWIEKNITNTIKYVNNNQKKVNISILISDWEDFKVRKIIRDKERHYKVIKRSNLQEDITILNVYVPNNRASKSMKQKLIDM